jgi:hypothetical protein
MIRCPGCGFSIETSAPEPGTVWRCPQCKQAYRTPGTPPTLPATTPPEHRPSVLTQFLKISMMWAVDVVVAFVCLVAVGQMISGFSQAHTSEPSQRFLGSLLVIGAGQVLLFACIYAAIRDLRRK